MLILYFHQRYHHLNWSGIYGLTDRHDDFFLTVLFSVILCRFHWRNQHRYIALIFNVAYFMYCEMIHGGFIWVLCIAFWVSNGAWNIFRASSFILAGIILIFNSMQCTWLHIKFIYCTFKGVSKLASNLNFTQNGSGTKSVQF